MGTRRRVRRRTAVPLAAALACVGALTPPVSAAQDGPAATLDVGGSTFWNGPYVDSSGGAASYLGYFSSDVACAAGHSRCFDYPVTLASGGSRFRAAVDWPGITDPFTIELRDPSGRPVLSTVGGQYSAEVFAPSPAAGTWVVRVVAPAVTETTFRARARLEDAPPPTPRPARDQLPNLRLQPPFELSLAGPEGNCYESERRQYDAVRCLRFSTGPANVGRGPLDLRLRPNDPASTTGTTFQRIRRTDGSFRERAAGPYEFHEEHNHFHHSGVAGFDLLRADPRTGALTLAGRSPKLGFCMVDSAIADWRSFGNEQGRDLFGGQYGNACGLAQIGMPSQPATGADIGLSTGWADVYTWHTEANYVEFPARGDGHYVVRGATDPPAAGRPGGTVLESDETDNVAYTYLRVRGDCVRVLERGYGTSPWDAGKDVVTDIRALLVSGQCTA